MSITNTMNAFVLRTIVRNLDAQDWEGVEKDVQPTIDLNGQSQPATVFFDQLSKPPSPETWWERQTDVIALDSGGDAVAARFIHCVRPRGSAESPEETYEFQEIVFAWFVDNRLARWLSLRDEDGFRARTPTVPRTPHQSYTDRSPPADPSLDLAEHYRAYIKSINAKTMEAEFGRFCQPELEHSGRRLSIAEYIPLISDSQDAIEDLHFNIRELLADPQTQQVAAVLEFTGTPVREWGGAKPNGKSVRFRELVMYQLHEGKIQRVWSVIELDAYREQLKEVD
ncbi:SnoaL-like polyketide cyclase [Colletotrichum sojae]|uniref:SnoaL-like polyketide cyclase n=1 Tax=Colletotrichum sojae TaxID=2175907 RepID=A0A8H6J313_9PEZI|nr:SnoaL-like polyketide cyclase [Colletotrichum sojae]